MRQRPLTCGHPDGPRELERLVPTAAACASTARSPTGMDHGIWFSGQQQTDRQKEAEAS
jgi:hypothetical protein